MDLYPLTNWDDDGADWRPDDGLDLPATPRLRRCGAMHDVGTGPWIGTMACCTRPVGHDGEHAMSLGDRGSATYWEETWPEGRV